jgi:DNA-binding PadR family transcriptional regulator
MSVFTYGTLRPDKGYVKNDIRKIWRTMTTLGYAILGLLSREALSGYDLTGRMKGRVGYFWSARHSQIYPELARLEDGGFVTHSVVEQRERPDKKVYEITAAGLAALKEWVVRPPEPKPSRDELVLKAYSVWLADPEEAATLFAGRSRATRSSSPTTRS